MNRKFQIEPTRTYATQDNADKAVAKKGLQDVRHFMMRTADGRWFPVFVGQEAVSRGVHFHFNVVG